MPAQRRISTDAVVSNQNDVDYPFSLAEIKAIVDAALAPGGDVAAAIALLDGANNSLCPLARATATSTAPAAVAAVEPGRKKIKKNRKARKGGRRKAKN